MAELIDKPIFIRSQLFADHAIHAIFTLRHGGISPAPFESLNFGFGLGDADSNINHNLDLIVAKAALLNHPHLAKQVHKTGLLWCEGKGQQHPQQADILITDQTDTALAVRIADCLPILLADPATGLIAAVHAGWRGTAAGVVTHAIQAMLEHGANTSRMIASLGPCIGPCCFAIGEDTANALKRSTPGAAAFISGTSFFHADLAAINRLQLLQSGLVETNIESIAACTACDEQRFYSYRRDGERSGRQLAVVATQSTT